MKILFLVGTGNYGGGELLACLLAVELKERGLNISVALPRKSPFWPKLQEKGLKLYSMPFFARWDPFTLLRLKGIFPDFDIIHSHLSISSNIAGKIKEISQVFRKNKPFLLLHSHGLDKKKDYQRGDLIITSSLKGRENLMQQGINGERLLVISNPIPKKKWHLTQSKKGDSGYNDENTANSKQTGKIKNDFEQNSEGLARPKQTGNKEDYFLCLARLHKEKGHEILFRAMKLMKNQRIKLKIVGDGPHKKSLYRLCRKLELEKRIEFCGHIDDIHIPLKGAKCLVLPSFRESMPLCILEAMAEAVPVIATRVGGISELIENGESGIIVPPKDELALAEAMDKILDDKVFAGKIALAGQKMALTLHDPDNWVDEIYGLYEKISKLG